MVIMQEDEFVYLDGGIDVLNAVGDLGHEEVVTGDLHTAMNAVVVDVIECSTRAVHFVVAVDERSKVVNGTFGVHGFLVDLVLGGFAFRERCLAKLDESRVVDVVHVFEAQEGNAHGDLMHVKVIVEVLHFLAESQ